MSETDPVAAARGLRPLIESEAERIEQQCTLTPPVVAALADAGLFGLLVPQALGGAEADPATAIAVCEALSFADGSVGWAFAQNATVGAYAAYLDPAHAEPLARARAGAGMFAPLGVAHREDGGFRVSGRYHFGSGSAHAEFVGGAATVLRDGEVEPVPEGQFPLIGFVLPADRVVLKGNWDVMGLRGTGSFDFEVPEQFVPAGATFPLFQRGPSRAICGGPLYGLGPIAVGTIGSCAWALGFRDLHVGTGHMVFDDRNYTELAKPRLGLEPAPF